jgi:transposase
MSKARYIKDLSEEEKKALEQGYLHGSSSLFRKHCQAILLSNQGLSVQELMKIFNCRKNTIYDWMNNWEQKGIEGLKVRAGRGRKAILDCHNTEEVALVQSKISENRKKLSLAKAEIEKSLGKTMCSETLRRFLKSLVMVGVDGEKVSGRSRTRRSLQKRRGN